MAAAGPQPRDSWGNRPSRPIAHTPYLGTMEPRPDVQRANSYLLAAQHFSCNRIAPHTCGGVATGYHCCVVTMCVATSKAVYHRGTKENYCKDPDTSHRLRLISTAALAPIGPWSATRRGINKPSRTLIRERLGCACNEADDPVIWPRGWRGKDSCELPTVYAREALPMWSEALMGAIWSTAL